MRRLLTLMTLIVVLAIIKASVMALVIALLLALLFAVLTRPCETLIFLGALVMLGFASAQPVICIIIVGVVGLAVVMVGARRRSHGKLLLTDDHERR